jgi:HK97 family phage prohead protease
MDDDNQDSDTLFAPLEVKFTSNGSSGTGEFSGYASVYNVQDKHGDLVRPKAFAQSLAEMKASGRPIPMHLMHRVFGGDGLPVGKWTNLSEDDRGLKVEGRISGLNTDYGRRVHELVKDGALGGLSIGYKLRPNGAIYGKRPGEPKRTLTNLHLHEISLVDDPSNPHTWVDQVKRAPVQIKSIEDAHHLETILRDAGVSGRAAEKIAAAGFAALAGKSTHQLTAEGAAKLRSVLNATIADVRSLTKEGIKNA